MNLKTRLAKDMKGWRIEDGRWFRYQIEAAYHLGEWDAYVHEVLAAVNALECVGFGEDQVAEVLSTLASEGPDSIRALRLMDRDSLADIMQAKADAEAKAAADAEALRTAGRSA